MYLYWGYKTNVIHVIWLLQCTNYMYICFYFTFYIFKLLYLYTLMYPLCMIYSWINPFWILESLKTHNVRTMKSPVLYQAQLLTSPRGRRWTLWGERHCRIPIAVPCPRSTYSVMSGSHSVRRYYSGSNWPCKII